jgi:hypothetical protein
VPALFPHTFLNYRQFLITTAITIIFSVEKSILMSLLNFWIRHSILCLRLIFKVAKKVDFSNFGMSVAIFTAKMAVALPF